MEIGEESQADKQWSWDVNPGSPTTDPMSLAPQTTQHIPYMHIKSKL